MEQYRVCSLFAGAGGIDYAFEQAECRTIWANENDRDACLTYHLNFPDAPLDRRDIRKVPSEIIPDFDILVGGFPCQPFSSAGKEEGFQDERGNLFFEICRVIDAKRPKALLLENVASLVSHDNGNTFCVIREQLSTRGYHLTWLVADAQDYGFPQRRNRIYIVGFEDERVLVKFQFPEKSLPEKHIFDIIDRTVKAPDWCYLQPGTEQYKKMDQAIRDDNEMYRFSDGKFAARGGVLSSRGGIAFTLLAGMGNWHDREPVIRDQWGIRKLTPYECFMLQGYPKEFSLDGIPLKSAYRQAGNTVCVPVVRQFADGIVAAMRRTEQERKQKSELKPELALGSALVGTVRNRQQLEAALRANFYHFPVKYMPGHMGQVEYMALYIPSWLSGESAGIRYYGRITRYSVIPRSRITELPRQSETEYCRVDVETWKPYTGDRTVQMTSPVILLSANGSK